MDSKTYQIIQNKIRSRYLPTGFALMLDILLYTSRLLTRYPLDDRNDSLSCKPLFIVSAGRSGTTLLRSMLAVEKQIAIPPESIVIPTAIRRFITLQYIGWQDLCRLIVALFESGGNFHLWETSLQPLYRQLFVLKESERSLAKIIDEIFSQYRSQQFPEAHSWGDHSTMNTLHLSRIYKTFPQAYYLHMIRDGRDAIASMIAKGDGLEYSTTRWKSSVTQAVNLGKKINKSQFLEIQYENLVKQPEETLNIVCDFVGIDYSSSMLDYWSAPTTIEHKEYDHHRNISHRLFTSSIGSWRERLSEEEQAYINKHVGGLLGSLGYY